MSDRTPERYLSERAGASNGRDTSNSESDDSRRSQDNSQRPLTPDEIPDRDCPVCLNRIENWALTNTCQHEFCFPCIQQWSRSDNRCPVCRSVYLAIYHNIRSESDYDEEVVPNHLVAGNDLEGVTVPLNASRTLLALVGNTGFLRTGNMALFIITRRQTPYGLRLNIEFAGPGQDRILPNFYTRISPYDFEQNVVISTPENLDETVRNMSARIWPHRRHRR